MDNKDITQTYGEFVGVSDLFFAVVEKDTATEYQAGTPEFLAPAAMIGGQPQINIQPTYYDNKPFQTYIGEGETALTIVVSNVPISLMAKLLGKSFNEDVGIMYDSGTPIPPNIALGFKFERGQNEGRYYWYLKGVFSGGSEEAETKTNQVVIKTYQLTYTAVTTSKKWTIEGKEKALKRVVGDTSEENFDATDWFTAVKVPATA